MKVGHCLLLSQSSMCPLNLLEELTLFWLNKCLSQSSICHPYIVSRLWWHGHWIATHLRKAKTEDLFHNQALAEFRATLILPWPHVQNPEDHCWAHGLAHAPAAGSGGASGVQLRGVRDSQVPVQIIHVCVCVPEKDREKRVDRMCWLWVLSLDTTLC